MLISILKGRIHRLQCVGATKLKRDYPPIKGNRYSWFGLVLFVWSIWARYFYVDGPFMGFHSDRDK